MSARDSVIAVVVLVMASSWFGGCTSMPAIKHRSFTFPEKVAFVGDVERPYTVLGPVRSKVEFPSLDPLHEEGILCRNYYNQAVRKLARYAQKAGGDAVIDVRSVVFLADGRSETHPTPECSDDGESAQVLTSGIAVKWKPGYEHVKLAPQPPKRDGGTRKDAVPVISIPSGEADGG
jgi:hypothetical protein